MISEAQKLSHKVTNMEEEQIEKAFKEVKGKQLKIEISRRNEKAPIRVARIEEYFDFHN